MRKVVTDKKSPLFDLNDYIRSCASKRTYYNEWDAVETINFIKTSKPKLNLSYYKCPYCNNFHLTENYV